MTDLILARAAAASYDPAAPGRRIRWQDMSALLIEGADGYTLAVEGTDPHNILNLIRDANVLDMPMRDHPDLGPMPAGAADAVDGFFPLVRDLIGDAPWVTTGHSLGGQVTVGIAALMRIAGKPPLMLVPFDPPKTGGDKLAMVLVDVPGHVVVFEGSIVSHWPFFEGRHFHEPPVVIGDYTRDLLDAHSIERAVAWLEAREVVAAVA
jgi:hypothetical protein